MHLGDGKQTVNRIGPKNDVTGKGHVIFMESSLQRAVVNIPYPQKCQSKGGVFQEGICLNADNAEAVVVHSVKQDAQQRRRENGASQILADGVGCAFKASRALINEVLVDKLIITNPSVST